MMRATSDAESLCYASCFVNIEFAVLLLREEG
jgi:hypothetical protein